MNENSAAYLLMYFAAALLQPRQKSLSIEGNELTMLRQASALWSLQSWQTRWKQPPDSKSLSEDAAALSQTGEKLQGSVLADRAAAAGAGEGMSHVAESGQNAHLLPKNVSLLPRLCASAAIITFIALLALSASSLYLVVFKRACGLFLISSMQGLRCCNIQH